MWSCCVARLTSTMVAELGTPELGSSGVSQWLHACHARVSRCQISSACLHKNARPAPSTVDQVHCTDQADTVGDGVLPADQ